MVVSFTDSTPFKAIKLSVKLLSFCPSPLTIITSMQRS